LYLTQAASDKNSLLRWCDGVCWQWQYVQAHGNGIIYIPSNQSINQSIYLLKLGKITRVTEQNEQDSKDIDITDSCPRNVRI